MRQNQGERTFGSQSSPVCWVDLSLRRALGKHAPLLAYGKGYHIRKAELLLLITSKFNVLAVHAYSSGGKGQAEYTIAREPATCLACSLTPDASHTISQKAEVQGNTWPIKKAAGVPLDAGHSR